MATSALLALTRAGSGIRGIASTAWKHKFKTIVGLGTTHLTVKALRSSVFNGKTDPNRKYYVVDLTTDEALESIKTFLKLRSNDQAVNFGGLQVKGKSLQVWDRTFSRSANQTQATRVQDLLKLSITTLSTQDLQAGQIRPINTAINSFNALLEKKPPLPRFYHYVRGQHNSEFSQGVTISFEGRSESRALDNVFGAPSQNSAGMEVALPYVHTPLHQAYVDAAESALHDQARLNQELVGVHNEVELALRRATLHQAHSAVGKDKEIRAIWKETDLGLIDAAIAAEYLDPEARKVVEHYHDQVLKRSPDPFAVRRIGEELIDQVISEVMNITQRDLMSDLSRGKYPQIFVDVIRVMMAGMKSLDSEAEGLRSEAAMQLLMKRVSGMLFTFFAEKIDTHIAEKHSKMGQGEAMVADYQKTMMKVKTMGNAQWILKMIDKIQTMKGEPSIFAKTEGNGGAAFNEAFETFAHRIKAEQAANLFFMREVSVENDGHGFDGIWKEKFLENLGLKRIPNPETALSTHRQQQVGLPAGMALEDLQAPNLRINSLGGFAQPSPETERATRAMMWEVLKTASRNLPELIKNGMEVFEDLGQENAQRFAKSRPPQIEDGSHDN